MADDESIFNLIPRPERRVKKAKMYRSRHDPTAPPVGSTFTAATSRSTGTGAPATVRGSVDPKRFLRSGAKTRSALPEPKPFKRASAKRKPAVPKRSERPVVGLKTTKDFVTTNAVEAILSAPKKRALARGDRSMAAEVAEPDYLHKADYGKVPEYLGKVKEEVEREYAMIRAIHDAEEEQEAPRTVHEMDVDDVEDLLDDLKAKWDDVNAKYQRMCHIVKLDTIGLVRRKESYERELAQIEADIEKLSSKPRVFVADD
eukprot:PLAT6986.1.p1 GENE.PLAT6986.1~~PLAT6986.1.p1  ORF type:complete len:259 (+),score=134.78 PLAT6986.1:91-867(+)